MIRCVVSKLIKDLSLEIKVLVGSFNNEIGILKSRELLTIRNTVHHLIHLVLSKSLLRDFFLAPFLNELLTLLKLISISINKSDLNLSSTSSNNTNTCAHLTGSDDTDFLNFV